MKTNYRDNVVTPIRRAGWNKAKAIGKNWLGNPYHYNAKGAYTYSTGKGGQFLTNENSAKQGEFKTGNTRKKTINGKGTFEFISRNFVGYYTVTSQTNTWNDYFTDPVTVSVPIQSGSATNVKTEIDQDVTRDYYTTTDTGSAWVRTSDKWVDDEATKKTIVTTKENYNSYSGNKTYSSTRRKLIITTTETTSSYVYLYNTFMFVRGGSHGRYINSNVNRWKGYNNAYEYIADDGKYLYITGGTADGAFKRIFEHRRFRKIVIQPKKPRVITAPKGGAVSIHNKFSYEGGYSFSNNYRTRKPPPFKYHVPVFEGYCKEYEHLSYDRVTAIDKIDEENKARAKRTFHEVTFDVSGELRGKTVEKNAVPSPAYNKVPIRNDKRTYGDLTRAYTSNESKLVGIINSNGEFQWSNSEGTQMYCATHAKVQTGYDYSQLSYSKFGGEEKDTTFWDGGNGGIANRGNREVFTYEPKTIAKSKYMRIRPASPAGTTTGFDQQAHSVSYVGMRFNGALSVWETERRFQTIYTTTIGYNSDGETQVGGSWKFKEIKFQAKFTQERYDQNVYFEYNDGDIDNERVESQRINGKYSWVKWYKEPKGKNVFQSSKVGEEYAYGYGKNMFKFDTNEPLIHGFGVGNAKNTIGFYYQKGAIAHLYSTGTQVRFAYTSTKEELSWSTYKDEEVAVHSTNTDKYITTHYTRTDTGWDTITITKYSSRFISNVTNYTYTYDERTNDTDSDAPYVTKTATKEDYKDIDEMSCAFLYMNSDDETCIKTNKYVTSSKSVETFSTSEWTTRSNQPFRSDITSLASRHYTTWKLVEENTFLPKTVSLDDSDYGWNGQGALGGFGVEGFSIVGGYDSEGNNVENVLRHEYMHATMQSAECTEFTTKIDWVDFVLNPERTFNQGTGVLVRKKPHYSTTQTYDATTWYSNKPVFVVYESQNEQASSGFRMNGWLNQFPLTKNPEESVYKDGAYVVGKGVRWNGDFIPITEYYEEIDYEVTAP